jgi:F-type H+-transporting ATPase subunit a
MEHPILFISLVLEALGLPVPHTPVGHTLLEKICEPYMTYTWMVMAFLIVVPKLTMGKLEMVPGSGQNFWEVMVGGLMDFCAENLGEKGAKMLYITLAMTLIVWVTHHVLGFKYHGFKYYKHFMGPSKVLAPFMFLLEIISNFARLISLSMRLFGNILAKEVLLGVLFMLAGAFFAPLPILCLGVLVSIIQAVVFVLLSLLYCAGSMEHAH